MSTKHNLIDARPLAERFFKHTTFGALVKNIRESDDISQSDLAQKIGVSRQFLNAIEHAKRAGSIDFALKVSQALGYPEDLFVEMCLNDMLQRAGLKKRVELKPQKVA